MEKIEEKQEEFDEEDLYLDDDQGDHVSTADEASSEDCVFTSEAEPALHEGSGKSSLTLQGINEDEAIDTVAEDVKLSAKPVPFSRACSLPAHSATRMGSSVPISIPGGLADFKRSHAPGAAAAQEAEMQYSSTFIPPHKMSQHDDIVFSLTGASPSAAIKRDRLRVRNAILKSTGFLENHVQTPTTLGLQERNRLSNFAGGLSQALQAPQV